MNEIMASMESIFINRDAGLDVDRTPLDKQEEFKRPPFPTATLNGMQGDESARNAVANSSFEEPPELEGLSSSMSSDDMLTLLRSIRTRALDGQLTSEKQNLQLLQFKTEANTQKQLMKIDDWVKKSNEAHNSGLLGKIFSWIGKIAAVIAGAIGVVISAALTVASGGAAAPMLALAVMALVSATVGLISQISVEAGGPPLDLGKLIGGLAAKLLEACGVDKKKAEELGKLIAGLSGVAMPALLLVDPSLIGGLAAQICKMAGVDPKVAAIVEMVMNVVVQIVGAILMAVAGSAASGAVAASSAVKIANNVIGGVGQTVQGLAAVGSGSAQIDAVIIQRKADRALVSKTQLDAVMTQIQKEMEGQRENIKTLMERIDEGVKIVSKTINDEIENLEQIAANIGKRAAV